MAKVQSPLLGYNTNVRHKGRVFHIQTEDSGVQRPHVITHLFADGGRILKSTKTSYQDHLDDVDLQGYVKKLMQEQHKAMFIALRDGQFDQVIESGTGSQPAIPAVPPPSAVAPASSPLREVPDPSAMRPSAPTIETQAVTADVTTKLAAATSTFVPEAVRQATPPVTTPASPTAVSRAGAAAPPPLPPRPPTPPAATGSGSADAGGRHQAVAPPPPAMAPATGGDAMTPSGRYAAVRTPIFASTRREESPASIFGDDWMSEKSLDEVILAYLAEDLDEKKK